MRRVVIVQESLPHYRVPFFDGLRSALAEQGVRLELVVGQPNARDAERRDQGELPWSTVKRTRRVGPLVWQPALRQLRGADLVILEQANRHLLVPMMLIGSRLGGPPVALWGHGANLQRSKRSMRERVKRAVTRGSYWFFAYTEESARRAVACGLPFQRVTVVQNAVKTTVWRPTEKVPGQCVFVGGLYAAKRLDFLAEAAAHIARQRPDFRLHIIGAGPDRHRITATSKVIHHGVLTGEERDQYLRSSELVLMPGLVGLAVLDAFAARAPMVTVASARHSPEIEYLVPDANGVVLPADASSQRYADEVLALLTDFDRLAGLRAGCAVAARTFTLDEMVARFSEGVVSALASAGQGRASGLAAGPHEGRVHGCRRARTLAGDATVRNTISALRSGRRC